MKQFKNPIKFSSSYNFGTNPKNLTNVKAVVELIIKFWGSGRLVIKKNKLYEQTNLQLNILKAKKKLKWTPTYDIKQSIKFTINWYKEVLQYKKKPKKITIDQIKRYMNDSKIT